MSYMSFMEIFNAVATVMTIVAGAILSMKGDRAIAWKIYLIASIFGLTYFLVSGNWFQTVLWCWFLVANTIAVVRKHREATTKR